MALTQLARRHPVVLWVLVAVAVLCVPVAFFAGLGPVILPFTPRDVEQLGLEVPPATIHFLRTQTTRTGLGMLTALVSGGAALVGAGALSYRKLHPKTEAELEP